MSNILDERPAGIIFDLDGTLLDTEPLYTEATQMLLNPFDHTFTLQLKKRCMGRDSKISAQIVIDEFDLDMSVDDYLSIRGGYLTELFQTSPDIPGAAAFVEALAEERIPFGLATSSHKHLCDVKLSKKPWRSLFTAIICGDNEAVEQGKPAPDIFLVCAKAIGICAADCIAFEDSPIGISAAVAAGMRVVAVNSPYVDRADLHQAELIIDDYRELSGLIASWN